MDTLILLAKTTVYAVMALSTVAALGVVLLPHLFYAALALIFVLTSTAILFFAVHAEFLATVQILLYVGAVMTLVIFAIMLTSRLGDKNVPQHNRLGIPAVAVGSVFLSVLIQILRRTPWPICPESAGNPVSTADLGSALMNTYVFPFEVISVVLIAALIGAIVIARRDKGP